MKRIITIIASLSLAVLIAGCKKSETNPTGPGNVPGGAPTVTELSIEATAIDNGSATIKANITKGSAASYKIVYNYPKNDLTIDPTSQTALINFGKAEGVEVASLPHEKVLTDISHGMEYISAIVSFDANGRASAAAYTIWTGVGKSEDWADDSAAGELDPNTWN